MKKDKQIQMKYIKPISVNKVLMRFRDKIEDYYRKMMGFPMISAIQEEIHLYQ